MNPLETAAGRGSPGGRGHTTFLSRWPPSPDPPSWPAQICTRLSITQPQALPAGRSDACGSCLPVTQGMPTLGLHLLRPLSARQWGSPVEIGAGTGPSDSSGALEKVLLTDPSVSLMRDVPKSRCLDPITFPRPVGRFLYQTHHCPCSPTQVQVVVDLPPRLLAFLSIKLCFVYFQCKLSNS